MEFDYTVRDSEVREAFWLHFWNLSRRLLITTLTFLTAGDLYLLWEGVSRAHEDGEGIMQALTSDALQGSVLILLLSILVFVVFLIVFPWNAVRRFRKFPGSSGVHHATVTSEEIEIRIDTGSSRFRWPMYKFWREGKKVVILVLQQGQYQLLPTSDLTEDQRQELRGILSAALPQKK